MSKQTNIIMLLNYFSMHSTYLNVIRGLSYLLPSICLFYPIEIIETLKNLRKDFKSKLLLHKNSFLPENIINYNFTYICPDISVSIPMYKILFILNESNKWNYFIIYYAIIKLAQLKFANLVIKL